MCDRDRAGVLDAVGGDLDAVGVEVELDLGPVVLQGNVPVVDVHDMELTAEAAVLVPVPGVGDVLA